MPRKSRIVITDIIIPAKNFFEKEDIRLSYAPHIISSIVFESYLKS